MSDGFIAVPPVDPSPEWTAVAIIMKDRHGRYLMQLRDNFPHIAAAGKWATFGGQIEDHEDITTAAVREIGEELGIDLDISRLTHVGKTSSSSQSNGVIYFLRSSQVIDPTAIRLGEGAGFAFLMPDQIKTFDLASSTAAMVDAGLFFKGNT